MMWKRFREAFTLLRHGYVWVDPDTLSHGTVRSGKTFLGGLTESGAVVMIGPMPKKNKITIRVHSG